MTAPAITGRWRTARHEVKVTVDVKGAPEHRTPRGNAPMAPRTVHIRYSLPTETSDGHGIVIELTGIALRRLRPGESTAYPPRATRRLVGADLPDQPAWLLRLIEDERPTAWRGVVPSARRTTAGGAE